MTALMALYAVPLVAAVALGLARAQLALLAVYALVVPVGSGIDLPGLPAGLDSLSSVIGVLTLGAMLLHLGLTRRRASELSAPPIIWVLFLAVALLTYLWSVDRDVTANELVALAVLIALYLVCALSAVDRRELAWVELGIVCGGAVAGLIALHQLATGSIVVAGDGVPRFRLGVGGEGGDPNITAATLMLPLAVGITRAMHAGPGLGRAAYAAAATLTAAAITLTASRGGVLGALAVVVVLALHQPRARGALLLAGLPVAAALLALAAAPDTLAGRLGEGDSTGRTEVWRLGLSACPEHCLAGAGWGAFPEIHERQSLAMPYGHGNELRYQAHNVLLATVVEGGIAALLLLLAGLAVTASQLARLPAEARGPPLAALVALVVTNMFVSNVDYKYFWLVLIYAALAVEAHGRMARR